VLASAIGSGAMSDPGLPDLPDVPNDDPAGPPDSAPPGADPGEMPDPNDVPSTSDRLEGADRDNDPSAPEEDPAVGADDSQGDLHSAIAAL
jgi:hypothetical protein